MKIRASLFAGTHLFDPLGPGLLGRRISGVFLALALAAVAAGGVLYHRSCPQRMQQAAPMALEHLRLHAEKDRLDRRVADYEQDMVQGHACHMGWVRIKLEQLRLEEQLACCEAERSRIRQQIADLESFRERMHAHHGHWGHRHWH